MKKLPSLSIFYPAYNDENSIGELITQAYKVGKTVANDLEVIVINDGSKDDTATVLGELKHTFKDLKIITHTVNQGYGGALRDGFANATKEFVFYTDGDAQYDPKEIAKLVGRLDNSRDVVNGFKLSRHDSVARRIIGHLYNTTIQKIYRLPIRDVACDFRLIRQSLLEKIELRSSSGVICLELIIKLSKAGARFDEVGVNHYERQYGRSQFFTPKNLFKTFVEHINFLLRYKSGKI